MCHCFFLFSVILLFRVSTFGFVFPFWVLCFCFEFCDSVLGFVILFWVLRFCLTVLWFCFESCVSVLNFAILFWVLWFCFEFWDFVLGCCDSILSFVICFVTIGHRRLPVDKRYKERHVNYMFTAVKLCEFTADVQIDSCQPKSQNKER